LADERPSQGAHEVVSFESEELIVVDPQDHEIGYRSKAQCHDGDGVLHRAFSLFVFDPRGRVLLQQRSAQKRLWPLYWSNSCCSHPRRGESADDAAHRRLYQELHLRADLRFLYKFTYHAVYENLGAEHELCWVYAGTTGDEVRANENEVADWRFVTPSALDAELRATPERFTPWFKLEWNRIRKDFLKEGSKEPAWASR
jgi:isopentenyl-diphosphate delta-isomerase